MNKILFLITLCIGCLNPLLAQRDLTPTKRKQAFGARDFRELKNHGFQVSIGPTYMLTKKTNPTFQSDTSIRPYNYSFDPKGLVGVFAEIGMAHYPDKVLSDVKLKLFGHRIISYYDWGLGFKYFGGTEKTTIQYFNNAGQIMNTETGEGRFYNGYAYGRFTLHHNFYINKQFFIDNGIGVNFDYRVMDGNRGYKDAVLPSTQYFHKAFVSQLHYDLGFGIRLKRGSYLIPGVQLPILGFYEYDKANPRLKWYSSQYRPILFKIKYIWLLEKKKSKNGCGKGSEEDKKANDQYMQGN